MRRPRADAVPSTASTTARRAGSLAARPRERLRATARRAAMFAPRIARTATEGPRRTRMAASARARAAAGQAARRSTAAAFPARRITTVPPWPRQAPQRPITGMPRWMRVPRGNDPRGGAGKGEAGDGSGVSPSPHAVCVYGVRAHRKLKSLVADPSGGCVEGAAAEDPEGAAARLRKAGPAVPSIRLRAAGEGCPSAAGTSAHRDPPRGAEPPLGRGERTRFRARSHRMRCELARQTAARRWPWRFDPGHAGWCVPPEPGP